ncbi:hypothetical protein [Streptomyces sp. NRRL F-2664]|uniref:hypothetical protein n=1 Tax=Streptomyces sp. NRRL F-2664 TaxID=1463842 RepID=UPI00131BC6D2|nr:hypothetical protein [Streptomyces sp. NRRL F-2664]
MSFWNSRSTGAALAEAGLHRERPAAGFADPRHGFRSGRVVAAVVDCHRRSLGGEPPRPVASGDRVSVRGCRAPSR